MLDKSFIPDVPSLGFNLKLKIDSDWSTSRDRLLIILQTVDQADLKAGELSTTPILKNSIKYARSIARKHNPDLPNYRFAVVNFNDAKSLHLKGQARSEIDEKFKVRVHSLIKKLKPTHILMSGNLGLIYPIENSNLKNGWVHEIDKRKVVSTLDLAQLIDNNGSLANLLGFFCRHLSNLLIGRLPYDLSTLESYPKYVNSIEKFDRMLTLWDKSKFIAVDTETKNLTVLHNAIYTIQFAFDAKPNFGFVVPVDHPQTPFTPEEIKYIKKSLRAKFGTKSETKLVTFNGIFDLRVIRKALKLDIIFMRVWEIMAGEHLLDENVSSLASVGIKSGGLAAVLCSYGNDRYISGSMAFSKAERNTTGNINPSDKDFLEYAALDVTSILQIKDQQISRSEKEDLESKSYKPYFVRHMLYQMSDTVHQLSHLKEAGSLIDKRYLKSLLKSDSVLKKAIAELNDEFKTFPEVQQANKELLADSGFKSGSLFGASSNTQWVFSFTKTLHKSKLFFEVMGLKAVSQTKTGNDAIDKEFIEHYRDRNFIVDMFGEFQAASKLLSTYVKGWYKQLTTELDGATDSHLRAEYKFFGVDTGRLASADPNLQNIPARGKLSKIIKQMFIAPPGHLLIRFDYSAHEVRGWSIVSGDQVLASAFKAGQDLRKQWIKNPTPELAKELKTKGDIHIQNAFRFFGRWIEKTDPLRDAVKGVVFGVLYGKGASSLGGDTKKATLGELKAQMNLAHKAGNTKELTKIELVFNKLLAEDRTEYAQSIIDKMFKEFDRGRRWILKMQEMATKKFYVYSPIGRIRHLYAALTEDKRIVSRQVRRGMNAPIQGFASEIAVKSSRIVMEDYYNSVNFFIKELGLEGKFPIFFNRIVHDASYLTVPYEMVIPFIHILQYGTTYKVADAYEKEFGLKFTVEPEIEMEITVRDDLSRKWDWSLPNLVSCISLALDDKEKYLGLEEDKKLILQKIFNPWKNQKTRTFLQQKFPLLDVPDLNDVISSVIKDIY